jgi:cytochrome c-type biogenesis protein CcmH
VPPPRPAPAVATAAIPGPTADQMEAARSMPPAEQDQMVRSMVERLATRLRQNPRDAQGWIQLMRSRMVLRQPDAAREALRSALAAFNGDAATQGSLREAARQLGVPAA